MSSLTTFSARGAGPAACRGRLPGLLGLACLGALVSAAGTTASVRAQTPAPEAELVREIFVPFDALSGILGGENQRVFMTLDEYRALEREARQQPPTLAPQAVVLLRAAYDGTMREAMAVVRGELELEVLHPGLHAVPLPLEGVALRAATLDGAAAPVARDPRPSRGVFFS